MLPVKTRPGAHIDITEDVVAAFTNQLSGRIIRPHDADYDEARALWNGMIDKHPALIVRCRTAQDVVAAVNFARNNDILLSVRGGGHNVSGSAIVDAGLVIDLSEMKAIDVDPQARIARAEAGVIWGELDAATQEYGLAAPGGLVSETGIAGLTVGGGLGWLRRKHGLSCDNLRSVEIVTADGRVLTANADENADLYWAVRGGGGNFGVVTRFEYTLHPVGPQVAVANVWQPGEGNHGVEALRFYRRYTSNLPDEVSSFAILAQVPAVEDFPEAWHGRQAIWFFAVYTGDVDKGMQVLAPLRNYNTPIMDFSEPMPFVDVQSMLDEEYPSGDLRYYWKSLYLDTLTDEAIEQLVMLQAEDPSPLSTIDLWHLGGAMGRVDSDATAFSKRNAQYLMGVESNWEHAADDSVNIGWNRRVAQVMAPFSDGSQYLNFPGFYEDGEAQLKATFGGNYERLAAIKAKYDPDGLFSLNR